MEAEETEFYNFFESCKRISTKLSNDWKRNDEKNEFEFEVIGRSEK